MKLCRKCQIELTPGNEAGGKYGNICKPCNKVARAEKHLANKEHNNIKDKENYHKRMQDPDKRILHNERSATARKSNYGKKYYHNNKDKSRAATKKRLSTPKGLAEHNARNKKREALKLQAMPVWANQEYIKLFYVGAKIEEARTGKKVDVDHIVPLNHELVCGLHCEHNLQLLTAKANRAKKNIFII